MHSGDSACVLPPYSLNAQTLKEIRNATIAMASELNVLGLMNVQYAVKEGELFVLEVNPRASRTVPFVSKATGVPLAKIATRVMLGEKLDALGFDKEAVPSYYSVKEAVLPFNKFPGVDTLLGPEMKSTGEVMGIDKDLGSAMAKAMIGAGQNLPVSGTVFISVKNSDKESIVGMAKDYIDLGFSIIATRGTHEFLKKHKIENRMVNKVSLGRPHVVDAIKNKEIKIIVNTGVADETMRDGYKIRRAALKFSIPYATTIAGGKVMLRGIEALKKNALSVVPIQEYHK